MPIRFASIPTKILADSITSSATSFRLNNITGWNGNNLAASDFGDVAYGIFRNATNTTIELFEFDPSTIADSSITIVRRGLAFSPSDLTTEVAANKLSWNRGDTFVDIGVDTPQMLQWLKEYIDAASIAGAVPMTNAVQGIARLSTAAASASDPIVVGDNDPRVPTADEKDAMAGTSGSPSTSNKFVTNDDTSDVGVSGKVIRATGTALPALVGGVRRKIAASTATSELGNGVTTEVTVFSQAISGNTLSTSNVVRFKIFISNFSTGSNAADDLTIRFKYGATTLVTTIIDNSSSNNSDLQGYIEGYIFANASTSAQFAVLNVDLQANSVNASTVAGSSIRSISTGTATENSTNELNLALTIQWGNTSGSNDFIPAGYIIEYIS